MDSEHKAVPDQRRNAAGEDDLMGVIADVEKQLSSLRQFKSEREEERQRLTQQEQALATREQQIAEKDRGLAAREAANQARAEKIDADQRALSQEHERAAAAAQKREADLSARTTQLEEREHRLSENAATVSRERQALDARAAELTDKEGKLRAAAGEVERERTRSAQAEKAAAERAEQAQSQAKAAAQQVVQAQRDAESARAEVQAAAAARDAAAKELRDRTQALEQAAARIGAAQDENKALQASIAEREGRVQELNTKLQNATGKFREVSERLKEQADLIGQANGMAAELKARDEKIAQLQAAAKSAPDRAEVSKEVAALKEQAQAAQKRVRDCEAIIAELKAKAVPERPEPTKEVAALKQQALAAQKKIRECEAVIAELEARATKGKDAKQTAVLNRRVEELTADLAKARRQVESLRAKPDGGNGAVPAQIGEAIMTRWRRLRRMRELLQDQGAKLRQAGESLRGRYEQTEQVLAQREELVQARAGITESRKKLDRAMARASKNKALSAIFHAVGIIAALGGISWAIAGQIAPASYAARATIAADDRAKDASDDQLAAWKQYHEALLSDPAMIEVAADRMGRRGFEALATPGALTARLTADMSHEAPVAGQVCIELRGQGRDKTVRTLEVFVNALVSQSNAGKERRPDGLATIIAEVPNALGGALSDQRPIYALAIFGAGFGLTGFAGLVLWRRLAAAKVKFEEDSRVDEILDSWTKPPEAFAKK